MRSGIQTPLAGLSSGLLTRRGGSAGISFGNETYPTRGTASNAPSVRLLGMIGDSRVEGDRPGQFAFEVACVCGEWVFSNPSSYNYGNGGSSVYYARTTEAPAAVGDGCLTFVVLTGTNGAYADGTEESAADAADPGAGIPSMTELEKRQYETLGLLAALDLAGATIFLCNEMPGGGSGGGTDANKVAHHDWIDTLTAGSAGLTNADLVIVNTWDAVSDGGTGIATELDPQWVGDGLHPTTQGQERMAQAVWTAMNAHFGTDVHLDFTIPSQNLMDGTSTISVNRGVVPTNWRDATAADDLVYATSGTGLDTSVTLTNNHPADTLTAVLQVTISSEIADGVLLTEYGYAPDPSPDTTAGGKRNWAQRWSLRGFAATLGASIFNTASNAINATTQDYETGGRRRVAMHVGATAGGTKRADLYFEVAPGQTVTIYRHEIHER